MRKLKYCGALAGLLQIALAATAKNGEWDVTIVAGKSAQLQLMHAGSFAYFCRIHPNMMGTIHVIAD